MRKEIKKCRICGNSSLNPVLDLGDQVLTGVFPKDKMHAITSGPLELVKCDEQAGRNRCGLLQLRHSYDFNELYGKNYGYRSGLNRSMVKHLQDKFKNIINLITLAPGDIILDIGSNDATFLREYPKGKYALIGIDPTGDKFRKYYPDHIQLIPEFFPSDCIKRNFKGKKAKVVTSIAMFYDLESPLDFMREVYEILHDDGVWIFEQNYMPAMLELVAYDTICHEHLEYYGLKQIKWMTDRAGFKIIDVEFNNINGGSFSVTVAKVDSSFNENRPLVEKILREEEKRGLNTLKPYNEFKRRVYNHRDEMRSVIEGIKADAKTIAGYGASTRGNVLLQFCGFSEREISFIVEINEDKFGCFTPGTYIPIIPEEKGKVIQADYLFVLPWHLKNDFLEKEKKYLEKGGKVLIPFPEISIYEN